MRPLVRQSKKIAMERGQKHPITPVLSALRITLESCLYVLVMGIVLSAFDRILDPTGLLLAMLAAGTVCFFLQNNENRLLHGFSYLPLLGPLLLILLEVRSFANLLLTLPPVLLLAMSAAQKYVVEYYVVASDFTRNAIIYLIMGFIGLLVGTAWAFPMALLCLVTQVCMLRILRQLKDHILTRTSLLLELLLLAGLCILCLLVGSHAFRSLLGAGISLIYRYAFVPIARLLILALSGVMYLFLKVTGLMDFESEEEPLLLTEQTMDFLREGQEVAENSTSLLREILEGLFALILVAIVVRWLIRRYRSRSEHDTTEKADGIQTLRTSVNAADLTTGLFGHRDRSPRGRIRRTYAKFLKTISKEGLHLSISDTSLDIHRRLQEGERKEKAARLRQLYLKARYDTTAKLSSQEAEQAAALEKELRQ